MLISPTSFVCLSPRLNSKLHLHPICALTFPSWAPTWAVTQQQTWCPLSDPTSGDRGAIRPSLGEHHIKMPVRGRRENGVEGRSLIKGEERFALGVLLGREFSCSQRLQDKMCLIFWTIVSLLARLGPSGLTAEMPVWSLGFLFLLISFFVLFWFGVTSYSAQGSLQALLCAGVGARRDQSDFLPPTSSL